MADLSKMVAIASAIGGGSSGPTDPVFKAGDSPPTNTNELWIDTGDTSGDDVVKDVKVGGTSVVNANGTANLPDMEVTSNKVYALYQNSTDDEYPSARCVYNALQEVIPTGTADGEIIVWCETDGQEWVRGQSSNLPIEYQAVEYIQGTGTQYIKYYYKPRITDIMKLTVAFTGDVSSGNYGAFGGKDAGPICSIGYTGGKWQISIDYNIYTGPTANNNKSTFIIQGIARKLSFPGATYLPSDFPQSYDNITMCGLFCVIDENGLPQNIIHARFYGYQILRNYNVVANFVPCYRIEDGVIGVYETVGNKFYTNDGTGTFLKGGDI